ncbi:hypothetical protein JCM1841_002553 [Sporobolomyces salmonicolor]
MLLRATRCCSCCSRAAAAASTLRPVTLLALRRPFSVSSVSSVAFSASPSSSPAAAAPAPAHSTPAEPTPPAASKGKSRTPPKPRQKKELPQLREDELEETFVRGGGPGGQATNKTSNACSLVHKPTGLRVQCHETRSLETNRKLARRIMREKLDQLLSPPGESVRDLKAARERQKKQAKRRKSKRKAEAKKAGGTEGEEEDRGTEAEAEQAR